MRTFSLLILCLVLSTESHGQERYPGLTGVHIEPKGRVDIPAAIARQLPVNATPRLAVQSRLSRAGELIVECETDDEGPSIVIFRHYRLVARFGAHAMAKQEAADQFPQVILPPTSATRADVPEPI